MEEMENGTIGMNKYRCCWLCGGQDLVDLFDINGFTITKCKDCTLHFVKQKISDEYLHDFYKLTDTKKREQEGTQVYLDKSNERNLKYAYQGVAGKIWSYFQGKPNLKILDLGCSNGTFLELFPDWEVYGIELEEEAGNIAKMKHKHIFIGDMKEANFEKEFFDCITIQDALDHSNAPNTVVDQCYKLLKPKGLIVIKVHNINCLLAKITGKNFYAITPPGHLTYFNLETLKLILEKNRFEYKSHFYNTQKLRLDTAVMRASTTFAWLKPIYGNLRNSCIGNIPFYKNYHDIITVLGIKK